MKHWMPEGTTFFQDECGYSDSWWWAYYEA